jgi:Transglutaminase-like superfamily
MLGERRGSITKRDPYIGGKMSQLAMEMERRLLPRPQPPEPAAVRWDALTRLPRGDRSFRRLRREARAALREANATTAYQKLVVLNGFINRNITYVHERNNHAKEYVMEKMDDQEEGSLNRAAASRDGVCFHLAGLLCMLLDDQGIKAALMYGKFATRATDMYEHCRKPMDERLRDEESHAWVKAEASGVMFLADPTNGGVFDYTEAPARGYTSELMYTNAEKRDDNIAPTDLAPLLRA